VEIVISNGDSSNARPNFSGWFGQMVRRLSISNKISCGYALAFCITILGTTTGVAIASRYIEQARRQIAIAEAQRSYIIQLQANVLQTRLSQHQMILLVGQPKRLKKQQEKFLENLKNLEALLLEIPTAIANDEADRLKQLVVSYQNVLEEYRQQSEIVFERSQILELPADRILAARESLIEFASSAPAIRLDQLSQDLEVLIAVVEAKDRKIQGAIASAETLGIQIISISVLLSVAVAAWLVFYTSRAIARPLKAATHVVKQVTQDSNFELQAPVVGEDEVGILVTTLNQLIFQVKQLMAEQQAEATRQLIQNEKMASLGRLVSGIAHEMNNALNSIYGNMSFIDEYSGSLLDLIDAWEETAIVPPAMVQELADTVELELLKTDLPDVLQAMREGTDRARTILHSLQDFSRLETTHPHRVNLHDCLNSTLLILNDRLKTGITVVRNYGNIPEIEGYAGFLYQVFMNLLTNAIDALESIVSNKQIIITTECLENDWVGVRIRDNGGGIPVENLDKIFDTFFTTKPRGVGTGLGLAISQQIVIEKHGGRLTVESEVGTGTEFAIALPIKHPTGS
jgi:two-component system, NtrC family, sensor kinase